MNTIHFSFSFFLTLFLRYFCSLQRIMLSYRGGNSIFKGLNAGSMEYHCWLGRYSCPLLWKIKRAVWRQASDSPANSCVYLGWSKWAGWSELGDRTRSARAMSRKENKGQREHSKCYNSKIFWKLINTRTYEKYIHESETHNHFQLGIELGHLRKRASFGKTRITFYWKIILTHGHQRCKALIQKPIKLM